MSQRRSRSSDLLFKLAEKIIRERGHEVVDVAARGGKTAGRKLADVWKVIRSRKTRHARNADLLEALNLTRHELEEERRAHALTKGELASALRRLGDSDKLKVLSISSKVQFESKTQIVRPDLSLKHLI